MENANKRRQMMDKIGNGFDPKLAANAVPERQRLNEALGFGTCKRCLTNNTAAGDIVVRHYGRGWWHDECYRVVNPAFYQGLADPVQGALAAETSPNNASEDSPF
jgi:hypothetical protein